MFPVAVEAQTPPQPVRGIYLGVAGGLSIETNPDVNGVVSNSLGAAGRSATQHEFVDRDRWSSCQLAGLRIGQRFACRG
jgi:hypothetical protein